jgi:integrase
MRLSQRSQVTIREVWVTALRRSGLPFRRMYETRRTFASWVLASGESPEWVARSLGHVNTSMVYKSYGCYIPNLTRRDGSALEGMAAQLQKGKEAWTGPIVGTISQIRVVSVG